MTPRRLAHLIFTFSISFSALAQTPIQPTAVSVLIHFPFIKQPAFLPILPEGKRSSVFTSHFDRVKEFQSEPGTKPVQAVNIASYADGDAARVEVSVFIGSRDFEKEVQVSSYLLRQGEKVLMKELAAFGVEPFEIELTRTPTFSPARPQVSLPVKSLEFIAVEPLNSSAPKFKLTIRNLSNKNITGIQTKVLEGTRLRLVGGPRGQQGFALILAGEVFETTILGVPIR